MICSSSLVPSVRVVRLCVSPRWNSAEPCMPQQAHLDRDRADLPQPASIETLAVCQDHLAHLAILEVMQDRLDRVCLIRVLLGQGRDHFGLHCGGALCALFLEERGHGQLAGAGSTEGFHVRVQGRGTFAGGGLTLFAPTSFARAVWIVHI